MDLLGEFHLKKKNGTFENIEMECRKVLLLTKDLFQIKTEGIFETFAKNLIVFRVAIEKNIFQDNRLLLKLITTKKLRAETFVLEFILE